MSVAEELHQLCFVAARLKLNQDLGEAVFAHVRERLRRQLGIRRRAPAFGALVRAWVESGQTHERDFKIKARSIRVALDALHDLCSRKAATKQLFKAMTH